MKKIIKLMFTVSCLLMISGYLKAQTEVDALRYSDISQLGTARYMGMGGAFGALGADMSTLSSNPAGIGLFRSSQFTFTPDFSLGTTKTDYLNSQYSDNKYNFALSNIGLVLTTKDVYKNIDEDHQGSLSFQFGFALNRYNDFNNNATITGNNLSSSMMTEFVNQANKDGFTSSFLNPYDTQLAYMSHLITNSSGSKTQYTSQLYSGNVKQLYQANYSGSITEPDLSMGLNYSNKLYIGATLGFPYFSYTDDVNLTETNNNVSDSVQNYTLHNRTR